MGNAATTKKGDPTENGKKKNSPCKHSTPSMLANKICQFKRRWASISLKCIGMEEFILILSC